VGSEDDSEFRTLNPKRKRKNQGEKKGGRRGEAWGDGG
jgi:hypothetical protein